MEHFDENKNDIIQNIIYVIEKKYEEELDKAIKEQGDKYKKIEERQRKYILEKDKQISNVQYLNQTLQVNLVNKEFRVDSLNKEIEKKDKEIRNLKNAQINLKSENQSLREKMRFNEKENNRIKEFYDSPNNNPNMKIEFDALKIKYKSKQKDVYDLESIKNEQIRKIKSLETKLNNLQKFLIEKGLVESHVSNTRKKDTFNLSNDNVQKASLGNKMDGSDGFHFERRENGKFGSLSSHDNYDDEYNEKFDSEI
jgi:predicted  nucleic acid-binding Zn-ribbon protein